ncbi:MAG: PAS domain S-box protein [Methanomicrobiales archaeon]
MNQRIRVLYIDDEPSLLELTRLFLEGMGGFCVDTATSPKIALDSFSIPSYDLILSDYQMPDMNGIAFLKEVRLRFGTIPFILFTGRGREEVVIDAINNGVDFYLQKGGDPKAQFAELAHKIQQAVAKKRTEDELVLFKTSVDQAYDEVFWLDFDGTIRYVNESACRITGYTRQELEGMKISILDPDILPEIWDQYVGDLRERKNQFITTRHRKKDGTVINVEIMTTYLRKNDIEYSIAYVRDVSESKQMQQAAAESRDYLQQIFSSVKTGIVIIDANTHKIIDINPSAAAMIGGPKEQIIGKVCHQVICPAETSRCPITDLNQTVDNTERTLITATGRKIPIIKYVTRTMLDGRECLLETFIDNSERRRAEEALKESEKKFSTVFKDNPVSLMLASTPGGIITDANDAFLRNTGYSRAEVIGRSAADLGLLADPKEHDQFIAALKEHHHVENMELRARNRDGKIHICEFSSSIIQIDNQPFILSSVVDITERKRAEDTIRESEERYRLLMKYANDGILVNELTPQGPGKILDANDHASRIIGQSREELSHISLLELDTPDIQGNVPEIMQKLMQEKSVVFQTRYRVKDGEEKIIRISSSLFNLNGRPTMLSLFHDITQQQQAGEALRQANKKLNLLSGITRHDISNQLMVLNGFLTLLQARTEEPDSALYLSRITAASDQIASMIRFMREYEMIGVHAPVWQDLRSLVDTAGREAARGKVTIVNDLPAGTELFADPLIVKVFFNLIDNALRHGETISTIRFLLEEGKDNRVIICQDDGRGVAREDKERIFDRGFGKNTGFGLAISRDIVDITGITIKETGTAGRGARFELVVPAGQFRSANRK